MLEDIIKEKDFEIHVNKADNTRLSEKLQSLELNQILEEDEEKHQEEEELETF